MTDYTFPDPHDDCIPGVGCRIGRADCPAQSSEREARLDRIAAVYPEAAAETPSQRAGRAVRDMMSPPRDRAMRRLRAAVMRAELTLATDDPTILELIAAAKEVTQ